MKKYAFYLINIFFTTTTFAQFDTLLQKFQKEQEKSLTNKTFYNCYIIPSYHQIKKYWENQKENPHQKEEKDLVERLIIEDTEKKLNLFEEMPDENVSFYHRVHGSFGRLERQINTLSNLEKKQGFLERFQQITATKVQKILNSFKHIDTPPIEDKETFKTAYNIYGVFHEIKDLPYFQTESLMQLKAEYEKWCNQFIQNSAKHFKKMLDEQNENLFPVSDMEFLEKGTTQSLATMRAIVNSKGFKQTHKITTTIIETNKDENAKALKEWENLIREFAMQGSKILYPEFENMILYQNNLTDEDLEKSEFLSWLQHPKLCVSDVTVSNEDEQKLLPQISKCWMQRFSEKISCFNLEDCQTYAFKEMRLLRNLDLLPLIQNSLQKLMEENLFETINHSVEKWIQNFNPSLFYARIYSLYSLKKTSEFRGFSSVSDLPFDQKIEELKNKMIESAADEIAETIKSKNKEKIDQLFLDLSNNIEHQKWHPDFEEKFYQELYSKIESDDEKVLKSKLEENVGKKIALKKYHELLNKVTVDATKTESTSESEESFYLNQSINHGKSQDDLIRTICETAQKQILEYSGIITKTEGFQDYCDFAEGKNNNDTVSQIFDYYQEQKDEVKHDPETKAAFQKIKGLKFTLDWVQSLEKEDQSLKQNEPLSSHS